jgi:hypothetical protein
MATHFENARSNDGFDESATPPWLMAPTTGEKKVILVDGEAMSVTSQDPTVATVSEKPGTAGKKKRELIIKGLKKGTTLIEVKSGGISKAQLEIAVKDRKTVKLAFNYVSDNAGHSTWRVRASAPRWVQIMNNIYLPQTNIEFKNHSVNKVKISQNLGKVVRFSTHLAGVAASQHEWGIVTSTGDSTADFNIFFVWEYEQDNTPRIDHTDAGTSGSNCIFEDRAGKEVGETLSHEAGHFLGASDTYINTDKNLLMYGFTDARGKKISKAHANIMNP